MGGHGLVGGYKPRKLMAADRFRVDRWFWHLHTEKLALLDFVERAVCPKQPACATRNVPRRTTSAGWFLRARELSAPTAPFSPFQSGAQRMFTFQLLACGRRQNRTMSHPVIEPPDGDILAVVLSGICKNIAHRNRQRRLRALALTSKGERSKVEREQNHTYDNKPHTRHQ